MKTSIRNYSNIPFYRLHHSIWRFIKSRRRASGWINQRRDPTISGYYRKTNPHPDPTANWFADSCRWSPFCGLDHQSARRLSGSVFDQRWSSFASSLFIWTWPYLFSRKRLLRSHWWSQMVSPSWSSPRYWVTPDLAWPWTSMPMHRLRCNLKRQIWWKIWSHQSPFL